MKVKIFDCAETETLEKEINDFIENTKNIEVIDIKYSIMKSNYTYNYSALIMYQYQLVMAVADAKMKREEFEKYICDAGRAIDRELEGYIV